MWSQITPLAVASTLLVLLAYTPNPATPPPCSDCTYSLVSATVNATHMWIGTCHSEPAATFAKILLYINGTWTEPGPGEHYYAAHAKVYVFNGVAYIYAANTYKATCGR